MIPEFDLAGPLQVLQKELVARQQARLETYIQSLAETYPAVAQELRDYLQTIRSRLDAYLASGAEFSMEAVAEQDKCDSWEIFKIVEKVDPTLPILQMHNEICAKIDEVTAKTNSAIAQLSADVERFNEHLRNVAIAYHTGDAAAVQQEVDDYEAGN